MDNQNEKKQGFFHSFLEYVKENLDSIIKLFINHIGMMIFSLVVILTAALLSSKLESDLLFYSAGVLSALMYFSLIYTAMWERGAKDKIRVDGGRAKKNMLHGLYFYLIANAIAVLTGVVSLILSFFVTEDVSAINNVYGVFRIISHYYSSMYLPITKLGLEGSSAVVSSLVYIAVILPGALVSFASYIFGLKGFRCIFPEPKYDKNRKMR